VPLFFTTFFFTRLYILGLDLGALESILQQLFPRFLAYRSHLDTISSVYTNIRTVPFASLPTLASSI
jgi:hypothetical protein